MKLALVSLAVLAVAQAQEFEGVLPEACAAKRESIKSCAEPASIFPEGAEVPEICADLDKIGGDAFACAKDCAEFDCAADGAAFIAEYGFDQLCPGEIGDFDVQAVCLAAGASDAEGLKMGAGLVLAAGMMAMRLN